MIPLATLALFAIGFLVMAFLRHRRKMAASFNAVQAEITLSLIELVPENPFGRELRNEIVRVIRTAIGSNESDRDCVERFNRAGRFEQLNIVANALWNLGRGPNLPNRVDPWGWYKVGNPVTVPSSDPRLLQQVYDLAKKEQGADITLPTKSLQIIDDYIVDLESFRPRRSTLSNPQGQSPGTSERQHLELAPNMPDVIHKKPAATYIANGYMFLVAKDVSSIGEHVLGKKLPLQYPWAMIVLDISANKPVMFVTLEMGIADGAFLCVFHTSGMRSNLGPGPHPMEQAAFEAFAIKVACDSLDIDSRQLKRVPD